MCVDIVLPTIYSASISSNNVNPTLVRAGQQVRLILIFKKTISNFPTVILGPNTASVARLNSTSFNCTTIVASTFPQGDLVWNVSNFLDDVGNLGLPFSSTTDASNVVVGNIYMDT